MLRDVLRGCFVAHLVCAFLLVTQVSQDGFLIDFIFMVIYISFYVLPMYFVAFVLFYFAARTNRRWYRGLAIIVGAIMVYATAYIGEFGPTHSPAEVGRWAILGAFLGFVFWWSAFGLVPWVEPKD